MDVTFTESSSIRTFSRALVLCSKISDVVQLTAQSPSLYLRALNQTHSAFFNVRLSPPLFSVTRLPATATSATIALKTILPIFRQHNNILSLHLATPLTICLKAKSGVTKRFNIPILETRVPRIVVPEAQPYQFTSSARFLLDVIANFHTKLDELTMSISSNSLKFRSFLDQPTPSSVILRTEMTLDIDALDEHKFPHSTTNLTLLCKPLRSIFEFCEPYHAPLTIHFHRAGAPVVVQIVLQSEGAVSLHGSFVLSSRAADDDAKIKRSPVQLEAMHQTQSTATHSYSHRVDSRAMGQLSSIPESTPRHLQRESQRASQREFQREPSASNTPRYLSQAQSDEYVEATQPPSSFADVYADQSSYRVDDDDDDDDVVPATPPPED